MDDVQAAGAWMACQTAEGRELNVRPVNKPARMCPLSHGIGLQN